MVLATWQVGQFVWSMLWFTLSFMWIYTVVYVLRDVFRSRDLSGVAKAAWTIFVMYLPVVGVLAYLIARGDSIGEHLQQDEAARNAATHSTIRTAVTAAVTRDDLGTLVDLHDRGVVSQAEFDRMKAALDA